MKNQRSKIKDQNLDSKIILAATAVLPKSELELNALKRELTKKEKTPGRLPTKTQLLTAYHKMLGEKRIKENKKLEKLLMRRAVRTLSGVTVVTSLTKPYPCPGKCIYCPLDVRMPKSYLSDEPAAARALGLKFDPYEQMARRIEALKNNGHPTDKIEFIVKGGTWNAYTLPYQYWFILRSFEACNEKKSKILPTPKASARPSKDQKSKLTERSSLSQLRQELIKQQKINEKAKHRIIGLTLETRPDFITEKTILDMREMGCTRVELGVQHTDNVILERIKRGHTNEQTKKAVALLKSYGFKTDFHLMPQLPGATAESDLAMLNTAFDDPGLRPDMIKIYPCSVVKGSELYEWHTRGEYTTYSTRELVNILKKFKSRVPRYVRISRLIRDIPVQHIEGGNTVTNLRQVIAQEMKEEGLTCNCLRCREIGHAQLPPPLAGVVGGWSKRQLKPILFVDEYESSGGKEIFLSFEDKQRKILFAFCRLRITTIEECGGLSPPYEGGARAKSPDGASPLFGGGGSDNRYPAYIRELHTYGQLVKIGKQEKESSQHKGLGKKLIKEAEKIAKRYKVKKLAVISGVGVRDYYRKSGYRLEKTYMVKKI